jgi:hypothetical protein
MAGWKSRVRDPPIQSEGIGTRMAGGDCEEEIKEIGRKQWLGQPCREFCCYCSGGTYMTDALSAFPGFTFI